MRNKNFLNLLVILGFCTSLFTLASCQGIKGEQGDPGAPGVDGKPGQDGEDGKDGNMRLTGEGSPSSSLGNNDDLYYDTSTCDIYQKRDGSWVKIGNNKGEDGEDGKPGENGKPGQDGENGSNGSQGPQGDTAWSNTILPFTGGVITTNVGSQIVGKPVSFTFTPSDENTVTNVSLINNGEEVAQTEYEKVFNEETKATTITLNMKENGFVVSASFGPASELADHSAFFDGKLFKGIKKDYFGNIVDNGSPSETNISFDVGDGDGTGSSEENALVINNATAFKHLNNIDVQNSGAEFFKLSENILINLNDATEENTSALEIKESHALNLNLNGGTITYEGSNGIGSEKGFKVGKNANLTLINGTINNVNDFSTRTRSSGIKAGISVLTNSRVTLENITYNNECENSYGIMIGSSFDSANGVELTIKDSKISSTYIGIGVNEKPIVTKPYSINIDNSTITCINNDDFSNGVPVAVQRRAQVLISNSKLIGKRNCIISEAGNLSLDDVELCLSGQENQDISFDYDWVKYDESPSSYISIKSTYNNNTSLTLKEVNFTKLLENGISETLSSIMNQNEIDYIFAGASSKNSLNIKMDKSTYDYIGCFDRVKIHNTNVNFSFDFEGIKVQRNVFMNGELYNLLITEDGEFSEIKSSKNEDIIFEGGDGTINKPLQISKPTQFFMIEKLIQAVNDKDIAKNIYYELINDIDLGNLDLEPSKSVVSKFCGNFNGNNFIIKSHNDELSYLFGEINSDCTISNLNLDLHNVMLSCNISVKNTVTFDNVNILESSILTNAHTNDSFYVSQISKMIAFKNCTNSGTIYSDYYVGAFIGGYISGSNGTASFTDCIFNGKIVAMNAGMLFGNDNKFDKIYSLTISNCVNNGVLLGYDSSGLVLSGNNGEDVDWKYEDKVNKKTIYTSELGKLIEGAKTINVKRENGIVSFEDVSTENNVEYYVLEARIYTTLESDSEEHNGLGGTYLATVYQSDKIFKDSVSSYTLNDLDYKTTNDETLNLGDEFEENGIKYRAFKNIELPNKWIGTLPNQTKVYYYLVIAYDSSGNIIDIAKTK